MPNLVATVQGYAKQEKDVLTQVTRRAPRRRDPGRRLPARRPEKLKALQEAQASFPAHSAGCSRSANYPDLKSNQNFLALQSQLEGTENRIAVARRDYIAAVQDYNTSLRTFPTVVWAQTVFRARSRWFHGGGRSASCAEGQVLIPRGAPGCVVPGRRR